MAEFTAHTIGTWWQAPLSMTYPRAHAVQLTPAYAAEQRQTGGLEDRSQD
jgi:hypothetical protein